MKKIFSLAFLAAGLFISCNTEAQADKSKRPSPPAQVTKTLTSGATVTIDYSQPSLKGRKIGTDVEPMNGKIWRAGANEATVFETDKDITVEGKTLPAGKYALFMTSGDDSWNIIFNKVWKTWGAYDYEKNKDQDALQVSVKPRTLDASQEKLTYTVEDSGKVTMAWGTTAVDFHVK